MNQHPSALLRKALLLITLGASLAFATFPAEARFFDDLVGHIAGRHSHELRHHRAGGTPPAVNLPAGPGLKSCAHLFPQSQAIDVGAIDVKWKPVGLCFNNFAAVYSGLSKSPLVVVERLTQEQVQEAQGNQRSNEFFADPRLARGQRAELVDYQGTGFDRGHMAPAGDQPDPQAMVQSFALSNMVPQDPFNNRKTWAKIESDVRKFARRARGNVYVYSGPLYRGEHRTIGRHDIWVPTHLFKLVYDETSGRSWAYIVANNAEARVERPIDYPEFVKQSGWRLLDGIHLSGSIKQQL